MGERGFSRQPPLVRATQRLKPSPLREARGRGLGEGGSPSNRPWYRDQPGHPWPVARQRELRFNAARVKSCLAPDFVREEGE